MAHVRAAQLCSAGARVWLAHHGIELARFLSEGVPAEELEATGDAFALHVAAIARLRAANG
jgi:hypothetical protein